MLDDLRKIIKRYNFPPEFIGKVENVACDIYDFVFKKNKIKIQIGEIFTGEEAERADVSERADKLTNKISIAVKDAKLGDKVFVPYHSFNGSRSCFAAYVHPMCKSHSIIRTKHVPGGWVITKIRVNK